MENITPSHTSKMLAETNRTRVLQLLYTEKELTRRAIGDILNLSAPTVTKILDKLIDEGLVEDGIILQSSGGRKPRTVSFVPSSHFSIGVEIMRHRVRLVIVDLWGSLHTSMNYPIEFETSDAYLEKLSEAIHLIMKRSRVEDDRFLGIAISICGVVRPNTLTVEYSSVLDIRDWDLSHLHDLHNLPIILINDAYAAGYMEFRNSTRMNKMFYISISEGVSGAYMIDNDVLSGYNNRAGSIGHMQIPGVGPTKTHGTIEELCSINVIYERFHESLDTFFANLGKKEASHMAFWDAYLHNLALALFNVRSVVDIAIMIGGALAPYLEDYISTLMEYVELYSPFNEKAVYIRIAYNSSNAAAMGAALQFVNRFLDF